MPRRLQSRGSDRAQVRQGLTWHGLAGSQTLRPALNAQASGLETGQGNELGSTLGPRGVLLSFAHLVSEQEGCSDLSLRLNMPASLASRPRLMKRPDVGERVRLGHLRTLKPSEMRRPEEQRQDADYGLLALRRHQFSFLACLYT